MLGMHPLLIKIMLVMVLVLVLLLWLLFTPEASLQQGAEPSCLLLLFTSPIIQGTKTAITNQIIHKASARSYCNSPLLSQPSRHWPPTGDCILHQQVENVITASQLCLLFWRNYFDISQRITRAYLI